MADLSLSHSQAPIHTLSGSDYWLIKLPWRTGNNTEWERNLGEPKRINELCRRQYPCLVWFVYNIWILCLAHRSAFSLLANWFHVINILLPSQFTRANGSIWPGAYLQSYHSNITALLQWRYTSCTCGVQENPSPCLLSEKKTLLVFTVLAEVILSTFAGVAVGGAWFADARGNVLTGVELTSVHALFPKVACRKDRQTRTEFKPKGVKYRCLRSHTFLIGNVLSFLNQLMYVFLLVHLTWVASTGVCAPVVNALAILWADVGVARVSQITAVFHTDLQALSHVHIGHVVGCLTHTHTLMDSTHSWGRQSGKKVEEEIKCDI